MERAQERRDAAGILNRLRQKNLLVVGLARNCGKSIKSDVFKIQSALQLENLHWLVIESDSADDTTDKLSELEREIKNFRFIGLGVLRDKIPLRTERIAYCRNRYIDEIKNHAPYSDIDYVIVADLDGINHLITADGFLSCFERNDWDVCAANQRGPYYDVWALRHPDWSPNDCWRQYRFLISKNVNPERALFAAVHSRMVRIDENADWIEVESAFGGFVIYRKEPLSEVRYVGKRESGEEVCEHVDFHRKLRDQGGRIFINPRLINAAYTEHSKRLLPHWRIYRRLKYTLKTLLGARN